MTIEQEEFDLQQAKEELNNIDYMFPYADPEYKEMARKAAQRRVDVLQLRVNRKKNIALNTALQNEAMYEEDKAKKMEDFANMSPLEKAGRATASTMLKIGGGVAKLPGYALQLGGFAERWRTGDKSGNDMQTAGEDWNQGVDDFIAEGTGFDSRMLGEGKSSLLNPSSWNGQDTIASTIRTVEGLQELKGGLWGLGKLGEAVGAGKYLSQVPQAVKTVGEGLLFGIQNIPEHSRYYEQTRGEFSPVRSVTTGLVSGQAMAWAFALGRGGLGMTESQAMNFARESVRKGTLDLTKDAFKQAARTALLNGSLNGVGASGLKEILASPENSTWEQKYEAFKRVIESAAHETMMGGIFGLQEGFNKNLSNRQTYRGMIERGKVLLGEKPAEARTFKETLKQAVRGDFKGVKETFSKIWSPEINDKAFDTGVNEYFFGKEGAKLRGNPEEVEKLFAGPKQNIDAFVEKVRENLPQDSVSLKDPGAVESALKAYKASLYIERNNTLLDRLAKDRGIDLNTIKEAYDKGNLRIKENGDVVGYLVGKVEDIKLELKNTNDTINKLDVIIKSKDVDLRAKQEAAQQKEEALLRQEELYRKTETPYTRAEVIEAVRDMVARKRANDPETLNRVNELLSRFLLKDRGTKPIDVDDAIALLIEVDAELNRIISPKFKEGYNSDIEDIISPKLIGSDVIYGRDERNIPTSVIPTDYTEPKQLGYNGVIYGNDERSTIPEERRLGYDGAIYPEMVSPLDTAKPLSVRGNEKPIMPEDVINEQNRIRATQSPTQNVTEFPTNEFWYPSKDYKGRENTPPSVRTKNGRESLGIKDNIKSEPSVQLNDKTIAEMKNNGSLNIEQAPNGDYFVTGRLNNGQPIVASGLDLDTASKVITSLRETKSQDRPKMEMPKTKEMSFPTKPKEQFPINDNIGDKVNRAEQSAFPASVSSLNIPQAVAKEAPKTEIKAQPKAEAKVEAKTKVKQAKPKAELESQNPNISEKPTDLKKPTTEKSSAEDIVFVDSTTPELKELMRKQNNQTAVEDGVFKGDMESFGELLHKERYIEELPSELNWMAEKFNIFKARNLNDLSPEQIDKTLEHIDSMKKAGVFRSKNGNKLFKVATNIKKYLLKRKAELAKSETKPSTEKPIETSSIDEENRKAFGLSDRTPQFKSTDKIGMDGEPEELQVSKDGKMATDNKMLIVMNEGESIPKSGDKEIRVMDDKIANGGYKRLLPDDGSTPRLDISIPYFKTKKLKGYRVSDIDLIAYPNGSVYLVNIENGNVMQLAGEKGMPMKNGRPADGAVLNGKSVETINKILGGDLKISHLSAANYPVVFEGKKGKAVLMPKYNDTGVRLLHEFANKKGVFDYTDKIKADKEYFDEISAKNKSYREGIASENAKAKEKKANEANDTKANLRNNHGVKFFLNNGEPDDSESISDLRRQESEAYHNNTDLADIPIGKFKAVKGSEIPTSRSQSGMIESTASDMYIYPNGTVVVVTPKEKGGTAEFVNGIRIPIVDGSPDRAFVVNAKAVEEASKILGGNLKIKGVAPSEGVVIFSGDNGKMTIRMNRYGGGDSNYGDIKRNNIILESAAKKGLIDIADVNPGKMNEFLKEREKKLSSSIKEFKDKQNAKAAERLAKAKAEQEKAKAELEAENNSYGGFLDGKKPFQQGAIKKALDKRLRNNSGQSKTAKEWIDELSAQGKLKTKIFDGKKKEYWFGSKDEEGYWNAGKTAYEYAKFKESRMGEDKLQSSRTLNRTTNPVTDKELNNFLRGQAKQITKETGLNFKVVDSVDELRKMFPNNDITDTVEGGIHNDTVYLVRGNIDKDRLPLVIAHEVAGHRGVESLFENKQQMDNFFNSLERAAAKDKFIRDAFAEVDRLGYKENRSREAMAKIVEKVRSESGTLKGTAKTFVNFITSRVRRLLRRMGFKNLQLSESEVYDIAVQALRRTGLKNSNKFFGLDRFLAKDNSFLSATSTELDQKYPGWQNQTNDSGGHTTQIKATVNTYRKIGEWIKNNMKGAKILDASSGLGEGTEALKQMGLNIEDVEPYASNKRKNAPIYDSYDKIKGKYDAIISNAVLNVIPDNWRSELLHNMVDKLNDGGKLFINVRDAKEVSGQKQKVELDSPSEILVTNGKGGYRAYQKGFTQPELESWVKKELGSGYKVEKANEKNSGMPSGSRAVVITKEGGNGGKRTNPRYEEITKQLNTKQLGNREFNNKATELGALKTLQGTKIERYKKTVGKEVGGQVYVHKNYANEVIPNEILDKAKKILSEKNPSFKYNTLMWDKNKGTIRFDEAPNFDTAPEPIPGKMLSINPITGEVKEAYSSKIWHHKWQWVKDDYNGFDIKESWNRSREWLNGLANLNLEKNNPDYSVVNNGIANGKANGYEAWNKQLKYYGLDHLIDDKNNTVPKADIQFSIGERKPRKVKPDVISEAEKKILDEIGEVKNPRDYNAVKKIAKNRMAEYKDVFSTKKNTGYKTAALKLHYLLGFDRKTQSVEKAFQSIRDFNTLQKTASAYARSIIGDKSTQASILDGIVKAKTFEKVYDIISKTNIAKEREIRKDLLDDFRNTIKELNPKKISTPTRMYTDEILGESFTPEELDSLIHSNEFTTKAVSKLRNIADNLASELGNIRKSDIEVSEYAINNAARLKHELNEIIKQRDAGNGAMNVPVEKLAEVNQLLKRFVNQDKLYKESLDTSAKNAAVVDREQILSESPEKNPKTVNSRETNSIGRFKEYFLPGKALKTQDNENVAATMGKTMHKVAYEDLLEGQNRQDHYRATGYKGVDRIMESFGKDLEDGREYLDKTAFKVKTSEGHEYEITNNEALAIIANYLDRETGQMIKKAGKVNFYLGEKKDSDYFTFTRKELDDMVNKLTPKQKKAIEDGFALLSNDFLPELNRVYEKLNGVPLRLIQGRYFPRMHVDVTQSGSNGLITRDRAPYIHQQMNADYQGILKQRDAMATPNLNLRGFTDTLQNYTDQASLYIGMAEPLRHLNRIMNGQMKRELTARYGAEYVNRINQMTRLMAGMAGKTEVDKGFATRYLSNLAAAKLTPLSAIKQLTSVPLASSVIPAEYLAKAAISGMSNENVKEMMELDGMILRYRSNGIAGIIPVNAKTWGRERIQGEKFKGQKLIDKAVGVGLNLSLMADKRALGIIYKATKLWAESQGKGSDKTWIENKFMEAVRRTQNTTDLASATGWQMDSRESGTMAFLNMYLNQTQKVSNEFFRNKRLMDEAAKKYGKNSAQYKEARNRTATFAASAALMEAMMLAIGSGASMLFKGKDEDSVKDKAITAVSDLTGNPLLKPMINAYSLQGVLKGKKPTNAAVFGDDFSGMIPEITYTMGRVMNDLQSDDPAAKKFRKLSYDMLSSKAAETSLALGRVPTWFARYPAKFIKRIWGEDLKNTRQKPSTSSSSGSSRLFSGKRTFGNSRTFGGKRMF